MSTRETEIRNLQRRWAEDPRWQSIKRGPWAGAAASFIAAALLAVAVGRAAAARHAVSGAARA